MLAEKSWGVQLWDQTSNLLKYQEINISLHERMQKFLIDVSKLQSDSFLIQKKFCEKSLINIKKIVGIETTYGVGFNAFIQAIAKVINTENIMAVAFELHASGQTKQAIEEERKRIKKWKQDRDRFQGEVKSQTKIIDDEIKRYNEKYREALRSKEEFERINEDKTYSKLDVEKALNLYSLRHCEFKQAQADYTAALEQFNSYRRQHYNQTLKTWGEVGQTIETFRITKTQELINVLIERLRVTIDQMNTVCGDLESAANLIDADKDTMTLIKRLKTGNNPPEDVPIVHLSITDPPEVILEVGGEPVIYHSPSQSDVQHYASTPVGLFNSPSYSTPCFPGSDAPIEPTETYRLTTPTTGTGRRFSVSSTATVTNGHSLIRKMFSRKSKRKDSADDVFLPPTRHNSFSFNSMLARRRSRRSKSISSYWRTDSHEKQCLESDAMLCNPPLREATSVGNLSRESERRGQNNGSLSRQGKIGRSLSTRETPSRGLEIIHVDHERSKTLIESHDYSDTSFNFNDKDQDPPSPISSSAAKCSLTQPQKSTSIPVETGTSDKLYSIPPTAVIASAELASRESLYSCTDKTTVKDEHNQNCEYSIKHQTKPERPPPMTILGSDTQAKHVTNYARSSELHLTGTRPSATTRVTQPSFRNAAGGHTSSNYRQSVTTTSRDSRQQTARNVHAVRQSVHQPKRHNPQASRQPTPQTNKPARTSTNDDLIIIGTGTALYDFDGENFGPTFLSFRTGDHLDILSSSLRWPGPPDSDGWVYAKLSTDENQKGFIPSAFVEMDLFSEPLPLEQKSSPSNHQNDQNGSSHKLQNNSLPYPDASDYKRNSHRSNRGVELLTLGQPTDI